MNQKHVIRFVWILIVVILATGVFAGIRRGLRGRPNWGSLQHESTYVWEHHESAPGTAMFGYLPTTVFALLPFMVWPPQPLGLILYVTSNVAATVISIWLIWRWWPPGRKNSDSFVWPVLLVAANFQHVIQANQLTIWALVLCVAGLTLLANRRPLGGGLFIGLAGLIKTLPFFLAGYLLARRQWRALAGVVAAIIIFDLVPCLCFFGWEGTVREHRLWLQRAQWHSCTRQINDPLEIGVYRHTSNFSYASVLTRWLRGLPDAKWQLVLAGDPPADVIAGYRAGLASDEWLTLAPMPPRDKLWAMVDRINLEEEKVPRFHLAKFSVRTICFIWAGSLAAGLSLLIYATWRTGRRHGAVDWAPAAALWLLAMFWVSPMMRHYYLVLAFPAIAVVWRTMVAVLRSNEWRWQAGTRLSAIAMAAWLAGVFCLGWDIGRWYGLHLGVVALLMAATIWAWRQALGKEIKACDANDMNRASCSRPSPV